MSSFVASCWLLVVAGLDVTCYCLLVAYLLPVFFLLVLTSYFLDFILFYHLFTTFYHMLPYFTIFYHIFPYFTCYLLSSLLFPLLFLHNL